MKSRLPSLIQPINEQEVIPDPNRPVEARPLVAVIPDEGHAAIVDFNPLDGCKINGIGPVWEVLFLFLLIIVIL